MYSVFISHKYKTRSDARYAFFFYFNLNSLASNRIPTQIQHRPNLYSVEFYFIINLVIMFNHFTQQQGIYFSEQNIKITNILQKAEYY